MVLNPLRVTAFLLGSASVTALVMAKKRSRPRALGRKSHMGCQNNDCLRVKGKGVDQCKSKYECWNCLPNGIEVCFGNTVKQCENFQWKTKEVCKHGCFSGQCQ